MLACVAFGLAACSGGDNARDQAVDALERANGAAGLETEMAALVGNIPATPTAKDQAKVKTTVADLDTQAKTLLASADTGQAYDEQITTSVTETRTAGNEVSAATNDPQKLGKARVSAVGRLGKSNESLSQATKLIGTDLADEEGQLSEEDAKALEATLTTVDDSGKAVESAGEKVASAGPCTVTYEYPDVGQLGNKAPVQLPVETVKGSVGCEEATKVFAEYYSPKSDQLRQGSGGAVDLGDWFCISTTAGDPSDVSTRCTRKRDGAEILTRENFSN